MADAGWASRDDLTCVIICGGLGSRMFPLTIGRQKTMLPLNEKPLLHYIVNYWRKYCSRFIFIASFQPEQVERFAKSLDVQSEVIREERPEGIARALAKAKGRVGNRFVTVLGDCLCSGKFFLPGAMGQGVAYTQTNNPLAIHQSYSLLISANGMAKQLIEKPAQIVNDFLGMGVYFFTPDVFTYIDSTAPSQRTGKVEITDVIQKMIDKGKTVQAVLFTGDYINVTYPEDFLLADKIALRLSSSSGPMDEWALEARPGKLAMPDRIERVLLTRTLPMPMFRQIVRYVRQSMPVKRLAVLVQPGMAGEVKSIQGVDDIILLDGDSPLKLGLGAIALIRRLRAERFDAMVTIYNNPDRTGYFHLEALAKLSCKQVFGLVPPARLITLSWWNVIRAKRLAVMVLAERALYRLMAGFLWIRRRVRAAMVEGAKKP